MLGSEEMEVMADGEKLSLLVKVIYRRRHVGASDEAEGLVLDQLKAFDGGRRIVGINDRGRVVEEGTNQTLKRGRQTLFVVAKSRVRNRSENI